MIYGCWAVHVSCVRRDPFGIQVLADRGKGRAVNACRPRQRTRGLRLQTAAKDARVSFSPAQSSRAAARDARARCSRKRIRPQDCSVQRTRRLGTYTEGILLRYVCRTESYNVVVVYVLKQSSESGRTDELVSCPYDRIHQCPLG